MIKALPEVNSLSHELKLEILKAVADVNTAIFILSVYVIEVESWPKEISAKDS